jgi:hypothetical protein
MEVWRRRREAASAGLSAAPHFAYHGLYSEAVVSSIASAVALAEVGQFREAVQYVQKAAKALYEAAKEVFERVRVSLQRLVELFVEAVTRVLAWVDEHNAYLFLMAAVAAGVIALSVALNLWGLVELDKLAYAAMGAPFVPAGVKEYSREEVFNILRSAPDPYEKFREVVKKANAGKVKLAEPWESLRMLIMPRSSEKKRLMVGRGAELYSKYRGDERMKKALFYATLALEEAFGVYRKDVEEREKVVQRREVGEEPFKKVVCVADLKQIKQLAKKEETAFGDALRVLRERLNEYAVKYGLRDLLGVNEDVARRLAEAEKAELSEFGGVNFGVKALATLIAYREYALGRKSAFGTAAWYWLEVGESAWLFYYAPRTAYKNAERAKVERLAAMEEMVAEALRRLFLKPGADHYSRFVEELEKVSRLALELEGKTESSYVFRLYNVEEGGGLKELGIKLWISKVREGEGTSIIYTLIFDVERWRDFFRPELEAAKKAAVEVGERLPVGDIFPYMLGWVASDVAIIKREDERVLLMSTSHLWQLAETHALFGWSVVELRMTLTLEGPRLAVMVEAPLEELDEAIKKSAEGGWLHMLGTKAGLKSWNDLKQWVVENWDVVVEAAVRRLGEGVRGELEALRNKLNDDKVAREAVAPALLLIQAEKLDVNETTLRYFGAVASSAIGGDGHVSAAMRVVGLTSGMHEVALLWAAVLAAHSIKTKVENAGSAFKVAALGGDAARLAGLYFLYGAPLLEGDERVINHKLAEAVELGAEGLDIRWEGLRRTPSGLVAADLTLSEAGAAVKYNVYLHSYKISLQFQSSDRSRAELAARLLRLAGVSAEVQKVGDRDVWQVEAYTDMLAAGRKELRNAIAEIVEAARGKDWVDAGKAEGWLEKLGKGRILKEGWPKYHVGLNKGALEVRFSSPNLDSIQREAQRLRDMGLGEGRHFTVKMPEGGKKGYVSILKEGLEHAAWLSVRGKDEQQRRLAAEFVNHILQRAEKEEGDDVYEKVKKIIEEGMSRSSLTLERFEKKVEVNGKTYVVKVIGGEAVEEDRDGRKLLRIKITAEVGRVEGEHIVDRVEREYTITYSRRRADNAAVGFAVARGSAPGGREADAERLAAVVEALTGVKPKIRRKKNGQIIIECYREHLDGFRRYAELAEAIARWLEETSR